MCNQTERESQPRSRSRPRSQRKHALLLTAESFHCTDEKGEKGPLPPSQTSTLFTVAFLVLALIINEQLYRLLFDTSSVIDLHPILQDQRNRHILARHIAVDGFACAIVAFLGYTNRHLLQKHQLTALNRQNSDGFQSRMHGYTPAGHQVLLFFFAYQCKNMYDTIKWNDGIIFVLHHLLAGATAWGGMYPGVASIYALFFMGISEISTCILCLLANFDEEFGVRGLDQAFPKIRIGLAAAFVVTFVICRIVLWPIFTFHFVADVRLTLAKDDDDDGAKHKHSNAKKNTLRMMLVSVCGLSLLQMLWLGEIVVTAKREIGEMLL